MTFEWRTLNSVTRKPAANAVTPISSHHGHTVLPRDVRPVSPIQSPRPIR
jgi:hypothetical protein